MSFPSPSRLRREEMFYFYFSVLSQHPPTSPAFFLSAEILSPPALCFNSEKQAPTHLSVFPYLQPHCVLQDLSTTQVTWVGGVEVSCGDVGVWGGGLVSQGSNTNESPSHHPTAFTADNKSFTSRGFLTVMQLHIPQYQYGKQLSLLVQPENQQALLHYTHLQTLRLSFIALNLPHIHCQTI